MRDRVPLPAADAWPIRSGLNALDTTAQILAWALVFGFAQELFTHFVDQQGQTVLNSVRAADAGRPATV
jgi:hypothetical protein